MASDKIARAMSVQNGLEITTKIGELSSEIDTNNSVIIDTDKSVTNLGNTKDGLLTVNSIKGNTLHNIFPTSSSYRWITGANGVFHYTSTPDTIKLLKPNTVYTYIIEGLPSGVGGVYLGNAQSTFVLISKTNYGGNVFKFTTPNIVENAQLYPHVYHSGVTRTPDDFTNVKFMILEGDWTNKGIPNYFEGIKSVGEDTRKISINNFTNNLFDIKKYIEDANTRWYSLDSNGDLVVKEVDQRTSGFTRSIYLNKGTYTISSTNPFNMRAFLQSDPTFPYVYSILNVNNSNSKSFDVPYSGYVAFKFVAVDSQLPYTIGKVKLEYGDKSSSYVPFDESKLEIPLSEPLRSLPNGVCDEIVNGKLIRRVGKTVLNGSEPWQLYGELGENNQFYVNNLANKNIKTSSNMLIANTITDRLPTMTIDSRGKKLGFYSLSNGFGFTKLKTDETFLNIEKVKEWITKNPITVYYELDKPIETILTPPIPSVKVFKNGTLIIDNNITPTLNVSATSNVSSKVYNIETELTRAVTSNNNAWQTLMILADKELRMKSLSPLTTESTTDLKNKINEMINIWR